MNRCPTRDTPLAGGLILFYCRADDGHTVRAADIDHEFKPRKAAA